MYLNNKVGENAYFFLGVKYLPGGVKSGFVHVDPDDEEKRLFQVKGKRNIKVRQVRKFEKAWVRKRKSE
jgi:hypothetical protein